MLNNTLVTLRRTVFSTIGIVDQLLGNKNNLFILCYHAVGDDNWRFGIQSKEIEKQMKHLLLTHKNVSLEDIENHITNKKPIESPSFAITFDDGYQDVMSIKEMLSKLKITPTVFVLGDTKLANRDELENKRTFLTKANISTLRKLGWSIQSHTMTHAYLPAIHNLEYEIAESRTKIKRDHGTTVKYIAYPKGGYTNNVLKIVKQSGYKMGLSMDDGKIDTRTNIYAVPRIGVDRSHSFGEFKYLFSPSVVAVRGFIKRHNFL